jgi:hypothetical protein
MRLPFGSKFRTKQKRGKEMRKIVSILFIILVASASIAIAKEVVCTPQARKFYLAQGGFTGSQALTACAVGYHMASLWEIFEVSTPRYDTTLGATTDDSGFGPPKFSGVDNLQFVGAGYIRTGF